MRNRGPRAILLIAGLLIAGILAAASSQPAAAQLPPPEQRNPAVAYNSHPEQQNFLVVWVEDRGRGPDIYGKRLFNNGLPMGGPSKGGIQVIRTEIGSRDEAGPRADPALVYNPATEEYVMVFSEYTGREEGWNLFSVRISPAGYAIGRPREMVGGPGDQQRPDIDLIDQPNVEAQRRNYLVVFDDNSRDVDEIWSVQLRSNNIALGQPDLLFSDPSFNASDPTTNGSSVAWVDDRDGQTDIWTIRLRNGLPNGEAYRLAGDGFADDYNPRYGQGGLVWNSYDAATGEDIVGVQVYPNNRTRGSSIGILVPVADQAWPDSAGGSGASAIAVYADNRSGRFNLYGIRTSNFRRQGREFPIMLDLEP